MRTILLASAAVIGLASIATPASANDIVKALIQGNWAQAADQAGEVYVNGQGFVGNLQNARNSSRLGDMHKYLDPNTGEWVFGAVSAVNVGNSISIEDVTPNPQGALEVKQGMKKQWVELGLSGHAHTDGLDVDLEVLGYDVPHWLADGEVDGNAELHGKAKGYVYVPYSYVVDTREFVKGDAYLNIQAAAANTQNAVIDATACKDCTGYTPSLENVSLTAANILNSISIEDKSSGYRGEEGDVYVNAQVAYGNVQNATANVQFASMVGGAVTAANIGNSINIKDACGVCE